MITYLKEEEKGAVSEDTSVAAFSKSLSLSWSSNFTFKKRKITDNNNNKQTERKKEI